MEAIDQVIKDNDIRSQGGMETSIKYIQRDIAEIKEKLDEKYVTQDEFKPVKAIVYGMVGLILVAVIGYIISLAIK